MEKKILIIDDDLLVLYGLQKALTRETVTAVTASTAGLALEKLSVCSYDLCLIDIHLPDYNGLELMKIIRKTCRKTKVIVMTASCTGDDELSDNIRYAAENGACHFISKPFDLEEVKYVVRQALHNEDFHIDVRLSDKTDVKKQRRFRRRICSHEMDIAMTIIGGGEVQRWHTKGESVDISEGGVGVVTSYPLRESQVVYLKSGLIEKTGVVVWSRMDAERLCRVGVRFA